MKSKMYEIRVIGCDDTTVFNMTLTKKEYELIATLCTICTATSQYGCQPKMSIEERKEGEKNE